VEVSGDCIIVSGIGIDSGVLDQGIITLAISLFQTMKVKRLTMTSFRGIGNLTLEFPETEATILIGINGVGKSSILDCLAILLSHLTGLIQDPILYEGSFIEPNRADGRKEIRRYFNELDITNGCNETHNEIKISLESQEVTWSLTEVRKGIKPNKLSQLKDLQIISHRKRDEWETKPDKANLPLPVYYHVNREFCDDIPQETLQPHSFRQLEAYDQALTGARISFKSFLNWFKTLEDVENELRRDDPDHRDRQLEAVRQAITSLLTGFSDLRVRRSPLRMTVTKQGQELIIDQLSDGEKGLLALAGDLARRLAIANPGLSEPLQGSGVVLIDEIELHLHPKWQRGIIPDLTRTFPNCQFIVTTHSPQVISQVKPEGIYILEKIDRDIVALRPESSYGRDSNRILEDLMDTPERPQEIKESLLELFRLIARGDLDRARLLHQKIADEIGADEPELVGASVSIRRREILGR
jgi:predicted ATP-binding protein involved in virulence